MQRTLTPHPLPVTKHAFALFRRNTLTTHPPYHCPQPSEVPAAGHGGQEVPEGAVGHGASVRGGGGGRGGGEPFHTPKLAAPMVTAAGGRQGVRGARLRAPQGGVRCAPPRVPPMPPPPAEPPVPPQGLPTSSTKSDNNNITSNGSHAPRPRIPTPPASPRAGDLISCMGNPTTSLAEAGARGCRSSRTTRTTPSRTRDHDHGPRPPRQHQQDDHHQQRQHHQQQQYHQHHR